MAILTADQVATIIGASPTEQLEALVPAIEDRVMRECSLYARARQVEVYDGPGVSSDPGGSADFGAYLGLGAGRRVASTLLPLRRWPVIEDDDNPVTVKIATDAGRSFASATALASSARYVDLDDEGPATIVYDPGFPGILRCVQVTYTAGYEDGEFPAEYAALVAELVALAMNRIPAAGLSSESAGGYSYVNQNFGDLESQLSAPSRMTLENGRARSNVWLR
jgi:hypothetical protein